ncbi:Efflux transporter, outer membrane factor lipoprotein, NodT family [Dokdonella koreensis DS-123]|uniref:Efflux transporter, outer membrane factor lipoprotein, NodT family n=2 Tax=Dokdonella TaxID=323413 RepID=A0A160DXG3_9GAMM|nr:efflux transporter outer membrane subunit [Dokdonella koreensis]ANB19405.1 Efflux transporter, outer membrane factor lipoprotein, NodT family [Dokdonella koreensis DS-123]
MRPSLAMLVLPLVLAAGCASTHGLRPEGRLRDPDSLAARSSLGQVEVSAAAWPRRDWWRSLGDPQLDALIAEALAGNPGLEAADARSRQALARVGVADADRQPTIGASASSSGLRIPETVIEPPTGGHYSALNSLSLSFSYGFDLWGGKRAAWEAAVDEAHAAEIDAQAARLTLSANVARSYIELAHAFERADIADHERERARHSLELTRQRVDAGIDSALQLRQAEAAVPAAEQQWLAATAKIDDERITLAALLGAGPDRGLAITRPQRLAPAALQLPATLPAELLGRRPDLVAARWRVEAADHAIASARAAFYPNIDLSAAVGLAALGGDGLFSAQGRYYQFAPAISLPIFDGGRLRANLAGSDAQYDLAVAQYNQNLVDALRDVAARITALRSLVPQIEAARQAARTAADAHRLAEERYRNGIGSYLDVLVVQQQLLVAEQRVADLETQRIDGSIALVQALGGGFEADAAPPADADAHS